MEYLIIDMKNAMELVEEAAVLLYQRKQQEGLQRLEQMIEGIMRMTDEIQYYQECHNNTIIDEVQLNCTLTNVVEVLARQDYVLLADLLTFELNMAIGKALNELQLCAKSSQ